MSFARLTTSIDAIQRAGYRFCDRLELDLRVLGDDFSCGLTPLEALTDGELQALAASFKLEVLDQTLRERIRTQTEPVRNLVLSLAFSRIDLANFAADTE